MHTTAPLSFSFQTYATTAQFQANGLHLTTVHCHAFHSQSPEEDSVHFIPARIIYGSSDDGSMFYAL
jgi:hypothetical protein